MVNSPGVLARLMRVIEDRRATRPPDSYTTQLLDGGPRRIAAKVREEAGELAEAALDPAGDPKAIVHEAADLIYHVLVLLAAEDLRLEDVEAELDRRRGMSGLAEKAAREGEGAEAEDGR